MFTDANTPAPHKPREQGNGNIGEDRASSDSKEIIALQTPVAPVRLTEGSPRGRTCEDLLSSGLDCCEICRCVQRTAPEEGECPTDNAQARAQQVIEARVQYGARLLVSSRRLLQEQRAKKTQCQPRDTA